MNSSKLIQALQNIVDAFTGGCHTNLQMRLLQEAREVIIETREDERLLAERLSDFIQRTSKCPDGRCSWCWEHGRATDATSDDGELCEDCAFERSIERADALFDQLKEEKQ